MGYHWGVLVDMTLEAGDAVAPENVGDVGGERRGECRRAGADDGRVDGDDLEPCIGSLGLDEDAVEVDAVLVAGAHVSCSFPCEKTWQVCGSSALLQVSG